MENFIIFIVVFAWCMINYYIWFDNWENKWIDCWIIASKMDILTDNWTGEYKRLSDLYIQKECPLIDVERIRTM